MALCESLVRWKEPSYFRVELTHRMDTAVVWPELFHPHLQETLFLHLVERDNSNVNVSRGLHLLGTL